MGDPAQLFLLTRPTCFSARSMSDFSPGPPVLVGPTMPANPTRNPLLTRTDPTRWRKLTQLLLSPLFSRSRTLSLSVNSLFLPQSISPTVGTISGIVTVVLASPPCPRLSLFSPNMISRPTSSPNSIWGKTSLLSFRQELADPGCGCVLSFFFWKLSSISGLERKPQSKRVRG